jgi:hypothetical protein
LSRKVSTTQVTEITRRIGYELEQAIERLYPDPIGAADSACR